MNPKERAQVATISTRSAAERAGFKAGDRILLAQGQPLLSTGDLQWVLHHAPSSGELKFKVERDSGRFDLKLPLDQGWRSVGDISWRPTSWDLRRMATGGLVLEEADVTEREKLGLKANELALKVTYMGQYGEHAAGKNAGFRENDIIVEIDGASAKMRETDLFQYILSRKMPGTTITATVLRRDQKFKLTYPVQ
jgi:S1-C subfamily serine protease